MTSRAEEFLAAAQKLKAETLRMRNASVHGTLSVQMADHVAVSDEFIVLPHHHVPKRTVTLDSNFSLDIIPEVVASARKSTVPSWSEHVLTWVTNSDRRLAVLGDLEEAFHKRAQQRGEIEAKRWYREHAAAAAVHFICQTATRLTGIAIVLRKLGLL